MSPAKRPSNRLASIGSYVSALFTETESGETPSFGTYLIGIVVAAAVVALVGFVWVSLAR
jgi:cobalamin biosynthesis Mg chelatase CobN